MQYEIKAQGMTGQQIAEVAAEQGIKLEKWEITADSIYVYNRGHQGLMERALTSRKPATQRDDSPAARALRYGRSLGVNGGVWDEAETH